MDTGSARERAETDNGGNRSDFREAVARSGELALSVTRAGTGNPSVIGVGWILPDSTMQATAFPSEDSKHECS